MPPNPRTREQILDYLRANGPSSARDIARSLDVTIADIRYHLGLLIKENKVLQIPPSPGPHHGRGRPRSLFALALEGSDGMYWLCEVLLSYISQETAVLEKISRLAIASKYNPPSTNMTARLNHSVHFLNQHGYAARWEASHDGPRILLSRCPFWPLPLHHPILCSLDCLILEGLSGLPLTQHQRINMEAGSPLSCVFGIRKPDHV